MNLSIKNVPEDLVERLRVRARTHHRSLQGEVLQILEESAGPRKLTLQEFAQRMKQVDFFSPSESTQIIREMRDARERELYERVTGRSWKSDFNADSWISQP